MFTQRISNYYHVEWHLLPSPRQAGTLPPEEQKKSEGNLIFDRLQQHDLLILLDETGKQFSSEDLSIFIQAKADAGAKTLIFLIGGAFGVTDALKKRANLTWSLSSLVFPHQLVRLILAEQVYRACTIQRNEKYHHA